MIVEINPDLTRETEVPEECPRCGATFFESYDEVTSEFICFCGKRFGGEFSDDDKDDEEDLIWKD